MFLPSYISCLIVPWLSLFGQVAEHQEGFLFLTLSLTSVLWQEQSVVMSGLLPSALTFRAIEEHLEKSINLVSSWFFHLCPQVSQQTVREVQLVAGTVSCGLFDILTTLGFWSSEWHLYFHWALFLSYVTTSLVIKISAQLSPRLLSTLPLILVQVSYKVSL